MRIADEDLFKRLLLMERRRCERTASRFALLLVDMEELGRGLNGEAAATMDQVGSAIGDAMRETDITGWYRQGSVIGVILTTLNGAERQIVESVVVERTKAILSLNLAPEQMQLIWISCHLFPEDEEIVLPAGGMNRLFASEQEESNSKSKQSAAIKRLTDMAGSVGALLLFSPLFLVIAALIKCTSAGPVFFRQKRVGQFGREFTFLKFRSMVANNDPKIHREYIQNLIQNKVDSSGGTFKIKNDPRVTPIGRLIRKASLDELPQFINVLKGDMSLVGPRPPIPYEFENYSLWHRRRILEARPGITGLWQVQGRSRTTFDEMVRMDLRYIRNQSLWLDVKILLKTPFAILSGDGAY